MHLKNKKAIVTGASRGMGRAIAIALAKEGCELALIARTKEDLSKTAELCTAYGVKTKIYPFDLTQLSSIPQLLTDIQKDFPSIHILINDAGKYAEGDPYESDLSEWDNTLDLNFKAVYHLTNQVLRLILAGEEAGIVNICSISGLLTSKGGEIYSASKHALRGYAGSLFESIRERGIKVTSIYPGFVNTAMASGEHLNAEKMIQPEDIASAVCWSLSLPENACPTDITIRPQRTPYKKS